MTSAVIALALLSAGLGATVAVLVIRLSGLSDAKGKFERLADGLAVQATDYKKALDIAHEEIRQLGSRRDALEARRRLELDELMIEAARCSDAASIRRLLQQQVARREDEP